MNRNDSSEAGAKAASKNCSTIDDNNDGDFFEGPEKLLEIWFHRTEHSNACADLRQIPLQKLETMMKLARCEILSRCTNDKIHAYVLSESSMFVSRERFILKTCGNTTPLYCVSYLLSLARQYCGFLAAEKVFYSHKNFSRPQCQFSTVHRDFQREVDFLNRCFGSAGITYRCQEKASSKAKYADQWYLYALVQDPTEQQQLLNCREEEKEKANIKNDNNNNNILNRADHEVTEGTLHCMPQHLCTTVIGSRGGDQTFELSMSGLDQSVMSLFCRNVSPTADDVLRKTGIERLMFPQRMCIDHYLFNPNGYSMNGILTDGSYVTIHVTPEEGCSYVSFETNVCLPSYTDLLEKVLALFQPSRFVVNLFSNKTSIAKEAPADLKKLLKVGVGDVWWFQNNGEINKVGDYDFTVAFYSKFPS